MDTRTSTEQEIAFVILQNLKNAAGRESIRVRIVCQLSMIEPIKSHAIRPDPQHVRAVFVQSGYILNVRALRGRNRRKGTAGADGKAGSGANPQSAIPALPDDLHII